MSRQPSRKPESGYKVTIQKAMKALRRKLPGRVFLDKKSCFDASLDNLRLSFLPDAVVKVQTATEVGAVLKLAHKYTISCDCPRCRFVCDGLDSARCTEGGS